MHNASSQLQPMQNSLQKYDTMWKKPNMQQKRTTKEVFLMVTIEEARRGSAMAMTLLKAMAK
ncbi:hypothetical protein KIN20_000644 [Parelaphostrongylus tenuis]|uniref:Uncharacterized protein n=1 Tax=Parelaphostrongylus tenuis TaxID=148309 RepID=A0AAD5QBN3_PARTN|nr:hypothetical protein KIN20_000644 [Parelaphostrongylus tenuis]